MTEEQRVYCRNPDPSKKGVNLPVWKVDAIMQAIRAVVAPAGAAGYPLGKLFDAVGQEIDPQTRERIGKIGWHVMAVKFEMEASGELIRVSGKGPQRLALADGGG